MAANWLERDELVELIASVSGQPDRRDERIARYLRDNRDVVLRELGGRLAGGGEMTSPLHMTGDCWRFDTDQRNYQSEAI